MQWQCWAVSVLSHGLIPVQWALMWITVSWPGLWRSNKSFKVCFFFPCIHSHCLFLTGAVMLAVYAGCWQKRTAGLPAWAGRVNGKCVLQAEHVRHLSRSWERGDWMRLTPKCTPQGRLRKISSFSCPWELVLSQLLSGRTLTACLVCFLWLLWEYLPQQT